MESVIALILVVWFFAAVAFGFLGANLAEKENKSELLWGFIGFIFPLGLFYLATIENRDNGATIENRDNGLSIKKSYIIFLLKYIVPLALIVIIVQGLLNIGSDIKFMFN